MEIAVILILAAVVVWAVVHTVQKSRKGGGCCGEHEEAEKRIPVRDRNKAHYPYTAELTIEGMTCENCARRVENALIALDGVWARVDIGSHRAQVRLKSPPEESELLMAVRDAGYAVTAMK